MRTIVFCKTKFEGIHCYPEAPDEVLFLRHPHRHVFNVKVELSVFDSDREIEFIMLKHFVESSIQTLAEGKLDSNNVWLMGSLSCEQVAIELIRYLQTQYGSNREIVVTVDEDGENGAIVYGV